MKQVNIGVGHWLAVLVNNGARQMTFSLMGTFHKDFVFATLHDPDGIEANNLHDSLCDSLVLDAGSHAEVFQIVVKEADVIIARLLVEVTQSLRHRYVVVTARNLLRLNVDETEQGNKGHHEVLHHRIISLPSSTAILTCSNIFNFSTTSCRLSFRFQTK